jgi:DNA modification methylase
MSASIQDVLEGRAQWALIQGDCLEVLPTLAAGCVDMVLTDPPYAVSNEGMWHIGRPGKGKRRFDFFEGDADWAGMVDVVRLACRLSLPAMSKAASAYWYVGHREFGPVVDIYEAAGWTTRFLVWAKAAPSPPPPGSGWPSGAELCVYAYRPGRTWNHDGRNPPPNSVIVADSYRHGQPGKVDHPTQKPETVLLPIIKASSPIGGVVLDCFAGSGSIGVAALRLGRRFIGIEKDEKYAAIARERLQAETQGLSLRDVRHGQQGLFST